MMTGSMEDMIEITDRLICIKIYYVYKYIFFTDFRIYLAYEGSRSMLKYTYI